MAKLILPDNRTIPLLPEDAGQTLMALLRRAGLVFDAPCGGNGRCGKCAARVSGGSLLPPDSDEAGLIRTYGNGHRLLCRARIADAGKDIVLETLPEPAALHAPAVSAPRASDPGLGLAVDLGTTTVELSLNDLSRAGAPLASIRFLNPQRTFGADVMSRLSAARAGKAAEMRSLLQAELLRQMELLIDRSGRSGFPGRAALCGNPAMLCLALGIETAGLCRAPFTLPDPFGRVLPLDLLFPGRKGLLCVPPATGPFTGADMTAALIASGFDTLSAPAMFADLGTNAELCLFDGERLLCCSAAAGPAFEGAGIRMGGLYGPGAITSAASVNGALSVKTIDETPADRLCANGLFESVAALLSLGRIDPSGTVVSPEERENGIRLGDTDVFLFKEDIRALQTAKAAVRAALGFLIGKAGVPGPLPLHVTGGIACTNAFRTLGLIPPECVPVRGRSALSGAELLLKAPDAVMAHMQALAARCTVIPLAGDPAFEEAFLNALSFPDAE